MIDAAPVPARDAPVRVVWSPLLGSQAMAIACPCNRIFYEGTRGPGKTDAQLMKFRSIVGQGYGKFWRGVIFDREYKNLDDLVAKSLRWYPEFMDGVKFRLAKSDYKWVWPTGEELLFRSVNKESDYWDYHGQEFPFIGWNELTKYPDRKLYDAMMSCNRTSFLPNEHSPDINKPLPEIPLVVFSTSNPYGVGHNWCKAEFIDKAAPGQIVRVKTNVYNPRTQQREDVTSTQVRIFGSYKENRYLSPLYVAGLENIKEPNKRKAWLWGDWDIVAGGAIDDLWNPAIHVVPRFVIPASWHIDRAFDWGSTKPFSVGWWAEASGEEVQLENGMTWAPPAGSLVQFAEWYGTTEIGSNEGLKMAAVTVATGILERERALIQQGWIAEAPAPGPADNSISNVTEKGSESIEVKMEKAGVKWTRSDKKPGSRKNGLQLLRDRLEAAVWNVFGDVESAPPMFSFTGNVIKEKTGPGPGIYFMDHCRAAISTLPVLPRDEKEPDDVDSEAEDHAYDQTRYRCLASPERLARFINVKHPT